MIYLATPYSHPDPKVRAERFQKALKTMARLIKSGHKVFSPIVQTHLLAQFRIPTSWNYWGAYDSYFLKQCKELWVLKIDGLETSRGVKAEIRKAKKYGIPIKYIEYKECSTRTLRNLLTVV
nr:hypothetical protein 13 [Candidatus Omnitrophota bacterium]